VVVVVVLLAAIAAAADKRDKQGEDIPTTNLFGTCDKMEKMEECVLNDTALARA